MTRRTSKLRKGRGIGFEDVVFHIERRDLLDILEHARRGSMTLAHDTSSMIARG
jgi:hypothetical protein